MRAERRVGLLVVPMLVMVSIVSGCNPCEQDGQAYICGAFGEAGFTFAARGARWPPVSTARSTVLLNTETELVEIDASGNRSALSAFDERPSAVSLSSRGQVYFMTGAQAVAVSTDPVSQTGGDWSSALPGGTALTPPALGDDVVYLSVPSEDREDWTLYSLDQGSGQVVSTRPAASPAVVLADGTLRYLTGPSDCGGSFAALIAEARDGTVLWQHREPSGIVDFSPGPAGEVYVVNGDRELVQVSAQGTSTWSFAPDCQDCNAAAAPTVTADALFFPVWVGLAPTSGCDAPAEIDGEYLDPLYALDHQGRLLWTYDGFTAMADTYGDYTGGALGLASAVKVRHHPSGRPTVAADGTLFVAADGAVVALSPDGHELGYALLDQWSGEFYEGDGGYGNGSSWVAPGFVPAPLLTPDGRLFVFDGQRVRTFATGKPAATIPWTAPFGGMRNAGRVGG